ncbi:unnamed protein product, partial [Allacma fusca]
MGETVIPGRTGDPIGFVLNTCYPYIVIDEKDSTNIPSCAVLRLVPGTWLLQ